MDDFDDEVDVFVGSRLFFGQALPTAGAGPYDIVAGRDNDLWFTESGTHSLGQITTSGPIAEFLISPTAQPQGITEAEGAAWFTDLQGGLIGRITRFGHVITEYKPPAGSIAPTDPISSPSAVPRESETTP